MMARTQLPSLDWRSIIYKAILIITGSLIYAIGLDMFEAPNGLAAGGLTGLALIFNALGQRAGIWLPVGAMTIAMNVVLLAVAVWVTRNRGYVMASIFGILISGFFTDAVAPLVTPPSSGAGDLLISAIWGGVICGIGLGVVFRSGGNTGGTDIICQLIARKSGIALGTLSIVVDGLIVATSIPVFSLRNALYAAVAMYISGHVMDAVIDGPRAQRAAYIISAEHAEIANAILYDLGRGCTELQARGVWSGNRKPVLFCVLGRAETVHLKEIVASIDPQAIVIISEVHEVFGQGFEQITS